MLRENLLCFLQPVFPDGSPLTRVAGYTAELTLIIVSSYLLKSSSLVDLPTCYLDMHYNSGRRLHFQNTGIGRVLNSSIMGGKKQEKKRKMLVLR